MYADVSLVGSLARLEDGSRLDHIRIEAPIKLKDLLSNIHRDHGIEVRRDSTLILVNGAEASALDDLDTMIFVDYKVVLVPMYHGG